MQGKVSNYETDLFQPLIKHIEKIVGVNSENNLVPYQVIADHVRMLTFSIADGVMPSNEGRGYIVRRILRRASRFGRILNKTEPFIYKLVDTVCDMLGSVYPEIIDKKAHIVNVIRAEEKSFNSTLDRGLNHFDKVVRNLSGKSISGNEAFKLYDTYGFPLDLTQLIAREQNLIVDKKGFNKAMEEQKMRAKSAGKFKANTDKIDWNILQKGDDSQFIGYESLESESKITRWSRINDKIVVALDKTPFYAESGGQIGDTGTIFGDGIDLNVIDTKKDNERFIHFCEGDFDETISNTKITCTVYKNRRDAIKKNHTATHLLHSALKEVLGEHVHQAGSSVGPDHFRFDLTHFEKITSKEIVQVETIVNDEIIKNTTVISSVKSFDDAKKEGAEALFGEKYGNEVRVLTIGEFSKELCGGTHVNRTGDIGLFKIIEETSLAAGVRRIIAITGTVAVKYIQKQNEIISSLQDVLHTSQDGLVERAGKVVIEQKKLMKMIEKGLKESSELKDLYKKSVPTKIGEINYIISEANAKNINELKTLGDQFIQKEQSLIRVLGIKGDKKPTIIVLVTQDLVKKGIHAGDLARAIGSEFGTGGGGKPHMATTGAQNNDQLESLLNQANSHIQLALTNLK